MKYILFFLHKISLFAKTGKFLLRHFRNSAFLLPFLCTHEAKLLWKLQQSRSFFLLSIYIRKSNTDLARVNFNKKKMFFKWRYMLNVYIYSTYECFTLVTRTSMQASKNTFRVICEYFKLNHETVMINRGGGSQRFLVCKSLSLHAAL